MHTQFRSTLSALLLIACMSGPGFVAAQTAPMKTEDLTMQSDLVVSGKVAGVASEWSPKHDRIQTRVTVAVDQTMKGTAPGNAITVLIPGGEVDGVGEWYSHSVSFNNNESVVVFAKMETSGQYRVVGGEAGKVSVKQDEKTGKKFIPNVGTLEEFSKKIKQISKSQVGNQQEK